MSLNVCDISRFAASERSQAVGQGLGFVVPYTAVAFVGIIVTSAASDLYPSDHDLWNFVRQNCDFDSVGVL